MQAKQLSIKDFTYDLPEEKIARFAPEERDSGKLLQFKNGQVSDHAFREIHSLIPQGSLMIFNNTKVVHARLFFQKASGANIEVFCLEPEKLNFQAAFESKDSCLWTCLLGNAKRWKQESLNKEIVFNGKSVTLTANLEQKDGAYGQVRFTWNNPEFTFGELLFHAGNLPLPPYLNRSANAGDEISYQTIFAREEGSVAAPTAALHFTQNVLDKLEAIGIQCSELTLHVGAGTFMPVKSETLEGHEMHKETIDVSLSLLKNIEQQLLSQKPIIPVGTTTLRTLESLYWFGVKISQKLMLEEMPLVSQWDPYELEGSLSPAESIRYLINWLEKNEMNTLHGVTQIIIAPGYTIRMADALVTNFHQPNSTLLLLVSAMVGSDWQKIYSHALSNNYRFLSFGDSSLLWNSNRSAI